MEAERGRETAEASDVAIDIFEEAPSELSADQAGGTAGEQEEASSSAGGQEVASSSPEGQEEASSSAGRQEEASSSPEGQEAASSSPEGEASSSPGRQEEASSSAEYDAEKPAVQRSQAEPSSSADSSKYEVEKPFESNEGATEILRELQFARAKSVKFGGSSSSKDKFEGSQHRDVRSRGILKRESQLQAEAPRKSVFDPYLGLGALPTEPLPPLALALHFINSHSFERRTKTQELCLRAAIYVGSLGAAACFFLCLVLFFHHVTTRPRPPVVMMEFSASVIHHIYPVSEEVVLQQQQEGKGNYYAFYLNWCYFGVLNLTNPNRHMDFYFDYLEVTLFYRGFQIGFDRIEDFSSPGGSVLRPFFCMFALSLPIPLDVGTILNTELGTNTYVVVSELIFKGSVSILPGVKTMKFWTRYQCQIHGQDMVGENNCRLLNANWRPNNDDYPSYRRDYWTRFVDAQQGYAFFLPENYFDYDVNLYLPFKQKFNITNLEDF